MFEVLHRHCVRGSSLASWVVSLAAVGFSSGCVSYQQYKQLEDAHDQALTVNADLTKKYNQAMQQLMAIQRDGKPVMGGDSEALLAQIRDLKDKLASAKKVHPEFTKEQIDRIPGATADDGGLALGEALLFTEGSADLKREAFSVLDRVLDLLKREYPTEMVLIEGHTDNQPVLRVKKLYPDNEALAHARARAVFAYFHDKGIPESRMIVHSYSFNKPLDPDKADTKEGRRENRRVVVRRGGSQI